MHRALGVVGVIWLASCGSHDPMKPQMDACMRDASPDIEACLAVAKDRFAAHDEEGARRYLEAMVQSFEAEHACLDRYTPAACFHGVVAVLREPAVGVLADYAIDPDLLRVLPPWTGPDEKGLHYQAREALEPMCRRTSDPVAQSRACLVLGDLATFERAKGISGWDDVTDGYATACKIPRPADRNAYDVFAHLVATTYEVRGSDPVCEVATSAAKGASISDARTLMVRMDADKHRRERADAEMKSREAQRLAEVKKREAEAQAQAQHQAAATANKQIATASAAEDWDSVLDGLKARGGPLDTPAATALANAWDPFVAWLTERSSLVGAQVELARDLTGFVPAGSPLLDAEGKLRTRAAAEAVRLAKGAGGPGGKFLHAALVAAAFGPATDADAKAAQAAARAAYAELVASVRSALVIDNLPPACQRLARVLPGRAVHAKAQLTCTIEPEHGWTVQENYEVQGRMTPTQVAHRGFKIVVHGTLAVNGQTIPVDLDATVDEETEKLARSFDRELAALVDSIWQRAITPIDAAAAADALAAGRRALAQKNTRRAENELAIHALLASPSDELEQLLNPYRVAFLQLVPAP